MPTPSDITSSVNASSVLEELSARSTCPPEVERLPSWRESRAPSTLSDRDESESSLSQLISAAHTAQNALIDATAGSTAESSSGGSPMKDVAKPEDEPAAGRLSPAAEPSCSTSQPPSVTPSSNTSLLSYEFSNIRLLPNYTSSFLRPGSKFTGTQQSDRQVYNVDVEIKHVDMQESYLCGYLRIQGLTEDHPTLTTFFEGEIIGTKHTFKTKNEAWGATEKTDMQHWNRFPAWRPLSKQARKPDFTYRNYAQREHIFMRWKEYFLVPDHRVRSISGASFEGFYYICFNQVEGTVAGIYFHAKSEKYQQLELKHVEDHGCTPAMEFR